jgi:hypothetical protein
LNNDKYTVPLSTDRLQAPFYVKGKRDFDKRYPFGSRERLEVELQVCMALIGRASFSWFVEVVDTQICSHPLGLTSIGLLVHNTCSVVPC